MKRIAKFHKVNFEQFKEGWMGEFPQTTEAKLLKIYEDIKLPKRATAGSAGYDFYTPETFSLKSGETIKIPTGIRVEMEEGWVLKLYPRSGLGFKYRLQLDNSVGIIDSDYFYSDNEGHMFAKITNDAKQEKKSASLQQKTAYCRFWRPRCSASGRSGCGACQGSRTWSAALRCCGARDARPSGRAAMWRSPAARSRAPCRGKQRHKCGLPFSSARRCWHGLAGRRPCCPAGAGSAPAPLTCT